MNEGEFSPPQGEVLSAAFGLAVDAVTGEVASALRESGIPALLLKGPALARWLYDGEASRSYGDVDLLIPTDRAREAERILAALGFTSPPDIVHLRKPHAQAWKRADGMNVDLHTSLVGVGRPPAEVWPAVAEGSERIRVADAEVDVPAPAARALIVALHAAQHGVRVEKPLNDLARALERVPFDVWRSAASLAEQLEAMPPFATGLRLLPAGEALAGRLGLPHATSPDVALRAETPRPVSRGFARLAQTPGLKAKTRLVAREVVPEVAFMRFWSTLARRGRVGLAAAYVWRPVWLLWQAVPAFAAWRRAKRASQRVYRGP